MFKTLLPHIVLEVTESCNYACSFCYNHYKAPGYAPSTQPLRKATEVLAQLFSMAYPRNISLAGGEPTLSTELLELVRMANEQQCFISLISNGSCLDADLYRELIEAGVFLFEFPLLGADAYTHNTLVGNGLAWESSLQSMARVAAMGAIVIPLIVLTRSNIKQLPDMLERLHAMGLGQVFVNRFNVGGRGLAHNTELMPTRAELLSALQQLDTAASTYGMRVNSTVSIPPCVIDTSVFQHIDFSFCPAYVQDHPLTLDLRGNLRLCNHSPLAVGNIFEQDLEQIFASPTVQAWLGAVPSHCVGCVHWSICRGACKAAALQVGNDLQQVDPFVRFCR